MPFIGTSTEIRLANKNDIPMIMEYIGEDWRKGHVMSSSRELFEYELLNEDGTVNMMIAYNHEKKRLDGCLAFLKSAIGTDIFDTWGTIWKVRKDSDNLLGLRLVDNVKKLIGNRFYLGIGINPDTAMKIHKMLFRDHVAKMKHYYRLAERKEYRLAVVKHADTYGDISQIWGEYEVRLLDKDTFVLQFCDLVVNRENAPYKNKEYFIHRYFKHPIYSYKVYGIYVKEMLMAFFVLREDTHLGRIAIRIVDYYGQEESMKAIQNIIPQLFAKESVEYIDFYEYGFSDYCVQQAGFYLLEENDNNIIPNYFSPFVQENIDIWVSSPIDGSKFVKGDGDQDRPNEVK